MQCGTLRAESGLSGVEPVQRKRAYKVHTHDPFFPFSQHFYMIHHFITVFYILSGYLEFLTECCTGVHHIQNVVAATSGAIVDAVAAWKSQNEFVHACLQLWTCMNVVRRHSDEFCTVSSIHTNRQHNFDQQLYPDYDWIFMGTCSATVPPIFKV